MQNPFNLNWSEGNESSSLVSEISNMSILVHSHKILMTVISIMLASIMKDNTSNLFLIELIFKWPTIIFSGHWIFISLTLAFASRILLWSILSNEFGITLL